MINTSKLEYYFENIFLNMSENKSWCIQNPVAQPNLVMEYASITFFLKYYSFQTDAQHL